MAEQAKTLIDWAKRLDPTGEAAALLDYLVCTTPVPRDGLPPEPGGWPPFLDPDVAALEYRLVEERAWERASKEWWGQPGLFAAKEQP